MERAVLQERDRMLKEADERIAEIQKSRRDSYLKNRGFSTKLNITGSAANIGSKKEDESLLMGGDDLMFEDN